MYEKLEVLDMKQNEELLESPDNLSWEVSMIHKVEYSPMIEKWIRSPWLSENAQENLSEYMNMWSESNLDIDTNS